MTVPSLLVLDFDGVILDSARIKAAGFVELFRDWPEHAAAVLALHLRMSGLDRFQQFEAVHRDLLGVPYTAAIGAELSRRYSEICLDGVLSCRPVDGAFELLQRRHGEVPIWLASGSPHRELELVLDRRGLRSFFVEVAGAPAPKVETIARALDRHGVRPADAVFVGDAVSDLAAAVATGVEFIGVVQHGDPDPFPVGTTVARDLAEVDGMLRPTDASGAVGHR